MQPDSIPLINPLVGIPDNPSNDPVKEKSSGKILKWLGKFADAVHRTGIVLTGALPFSSRGIILNLALAPFLIPIRIGQSLCSKSKFTDKMDKYMDRDWNAGIQDFYIDLESPKNEDLRKAVLEENFRYVAYPYVRGNSTGVTTDAIVLSSKYEGFPEEKMEHLIVFENKLKKMGFKVDSSGAYYNVKTGNIFDLIYDKTNSEIVICVRPYKDLRKIEDISSKDRWDTISASEVAMASDWFGGVPTATLEVIKIGKIFKKTAEAAELTPVFVGCCNGGGLAQAGAVANGIKGIVFNSRPMGAGVRRYIGQSTIAKNAKQITTFSGRGDWLGGIAIVNTLAVIFERLTGIPVPRSVGTGYHLPDLPDKSKSDNHVLFYDAFSKLKNM